MHTYYLSFYGPRVWAQLGPVTHDFTRFQSKYQWGLQSNLSPNWKDRFPSPHSCYQHLVLLSCWTENLTFLLTIGWKSLSDLCLPNIVIPFLKASRREYPCRTGFTILYNHLHIITYVLSHLSYSICYKQVTSSTDTQEKETTRIREPGSRDHGGTLQSAHHKQNSNYDPSSSKNIKK